MTRDALAQRYCRFTRERLSEYDLLALAMASAVTPHIPGCDLYLAHVAEAESVMPAIEAWARALVEAWATERVLGPGGQRHRQRIAVWSWLWAHSAIANGVGIALWGIGRRELDPPPRLVSEPTWRRVRDFARDAATVALAEYIVALEWAHGLRRDPWLERRWALLTISHFAPRDIPTLKAPAGICAGTFPTRGDRSRFATSDAGDALCPHAGLKL